MNVTAMAASHCEPSEPISESVTRLRSPVAFSFSEGMAPLTRSSGPQWASLEAPGADEPDGAADGTDGVEERGAARESGAKRKSATRRETERSRLMTVSDRAARAFATFREKARTPGVFPDSARRTTCP